MIKMVPKNRLKPFSYRSRFMIINPDQRCKSPMMITYARPTAMNVTVMVKITRMSAPDGALIGLVGPRLAAGSGDLPTCPELGQEQRAGCQPDLGIVAPDLHGGWALGRQVERGQRLGAGPRAGQLQ